jgi:chorismate synthase
VTQLCYKTAGESHGPAILAIVEGVPAGLRLDIEYINSELARRQRGPGRSRRQQIECDAVEVLSGVRGGVAIGSPVTLCLRNRDATLEQLPNPPVPRPGHADLAGILKFANRDIRSVLERASARETAARTAAGALAATLLSPFQIQALAHVTSIGGAVARVAFERHSARAARDASVFHSLDPQADAEFARIIEAAAAAGDTVGGTVEIVVTGVPPGLGSCMTAEARLDGRLAASLMSIQSVKAVEIGLGSAVSARRGSEVHDPIGRDRSRPYGGFSRTTNHAGGIEGGMTNGENVVVRIALKPIPTMKRGAQSINLNDLQPAEATYQRSDVCAVPAASVVAENVVAFEIARAFLEKFGGDTIDAVAASFHDWRDRIAGLWGMGSAMENP